MHMYIENMNIIYGKCPKISNTKVSDKMTYANKQCKPRSGSSFRSSLIKIYNVKQSTKHFKQQVHKKQNLGQNKTE